MTTVRELAQEALMLCGQGSAKQLITLAERYPRVEIWTLAMEAVHRNKPTQSPLRYIERALQTAAEQVGQIDALGVPRPPAEELPMPLADRVFLERHVRKLAGVPIVRDGRRYGTVELWAEWDRAELAAAGEALDELLQTEPGPRGDVEDLASFSARIATWRAQYREASMRYELAKEAVDHSARNTERS